jgi:hypothetical protein
LYLLGLPEQLYTGTTEELKQSLISVARYYQSSTVFKVQVINWVSLTFLAVFVALYGIVKIIHKVRELRKVYP